MNLLRGRYQIDGVLGTGSQGTVLDALDLLTDEPVVLKIFQPSDDEQALTAFELLSQLSSPFLPVPHGFFAIGESDEIAFDKLLEPFGMRSRARTGQTCLVRGRVDGEPVDVWAAGRPWSAHSQLLWRLATVLADLHRAGFLHGDLKPEHVLVGDEGLPVLIDFGLSVADSAEKPVGQTQRHTGGTPAYMAPELFGGEVISASSDLYAFGVLAYELAAGERPFRGRTVIDLAGAHREQDVPPLPSTVSRRAAWIIAQLLSKVATERPSFDDVAASLRPPNIVGDHRVVLPFVGRLDHIESALAELDRGRSTWVIGPVGIGKTRFLQRVRWQSEARGWTTLQAPAGGRSLMEKIEAIGRQLAGISGRQPLPLPTGRGDRLHQIRALRLWLDALAPSAPPVLFWDDADLSPEHLEFLRDYRRAGGTLTFIATVTATAEGHSFSRDVLELGPLSKEALSSCVEHCAMPRTLTPAKRRAVVKRSEGNPRLLNLALADHLSSSGARASGGYRFSRLLGATPFRMDRWPPAGLHRMDRWPPAGLRRIDRWPPAGLRRMDRWPPAGLRRMDRWPPAGLRASRSLDHAGDHAGHHAGQRPAVPQLAGAEHDLFGLLGACPRPLPIAAMAEVLDLSHDDVAARLHKLVSEGTAVRVERGFTLSRCLSALKVSSDAAAGRLERLSGWLRRHNATDSAEVVAVLAGDCAEERVSAAIEGLLARDRQRVAVHLLGAVVRSGESLWCRRLVEMALKLDMAETAVAYLPDSDEPAICLASARLYYTIGRLQDATTAVTRASHSSLDVNQSAEAATIDAWVALRQGRHDSAAARVADVTDDGVEPDLAAELATVRAASKMLAGATEAELAFSQAQQSIRSTGGQHRLLARLLSFRAMNASRRGDLELARTAYLEALDVVDKAELDADLPTFLLNAGTAHDRLGELDRARELYRRGAELAGEGVSLSSRVLLLANRANISLRLNRFDEAEELLGEAIELANGRDAGRANTFVRQLRAETLLRRAYWTEARESYAALRGHFEDAGDRFALAEVTCFCARAAVALNQLADARRELALATALIDEHELDDLRSLLLIATGELDERSGDKRAALESRRRAIEVAWNSGDPFGVVEASNRILSTGTLPEPLVSTAKAALQKILGGLGPVLRQDYLATLQPTLATLVVPATATVRAVPQRSDIVLDSSSSTTAQTSTEVGGAADERLYRLLALTAKLARHEDYQRFIETALDTAIELSGAERGFLLLRDAGGFRVAVSRDIDGEPIRRAILKVSTTIAERVAQTGEPLVTVDALADERLHFAASVRDLSLSSILCLPIRTFGEVIGVLYLDHRFKAGAFPTDLLRLMMALADQLAVSMLYLDRMRALESRNREIELSRQHIQALLVEKQELAESLQSRCELLENDLLTQKRAAPLRYRYEEIVGETPIMRQLIERVDRVVDSNIPVLVLGESGTGKELISRATHFKGPRRNSPFVPINCGAIPESLIESELFGHVRGAFTGADRGRPGLLASADKGTVFLDEISELTARAQVKLLRVLQEKRVRPVGGVHDLAIDIRLVAASNRDLSKMVDEGAFRTDLYYRLAGFEIQLPPLRDRAEDIPLLVQHLLRRLAADRDVPLRVERAAMTLLYNSPWPGNVRQLNNILQAAAAISDQNVIRLADVKPLLRPAKRTRSKARSQGPRGPRPKYERHEVVQALRDGGGEIDRAARILGVSARSVYRYMKKWSIDTD